MKTGIPSALVVTAGLLLQPITSHAQSSTNATAAKVSARPAKTISTAAMPKPAATAARVPVAPDNLSDGTAQLVKLFQKGTSHQELLHYVKTSAAAFNLSVADVNYLKDLGVSTDVVFAMIRNDGARQNALAQNRLRNSVQSWASSDQVTENRATTPITAAGSGQVIVEAAGSSSTALNPEDNSAPKYYDSTDNTRAAAPVVVPSYGYPYSSPAPGYGYGNGYDNRYISPGYNNYNGYNSYQGNGYYNNQGLNNPR
jgi:hypothetical protein